MNHKEILAHAVETSGLELGALVFLVSECDIQGPLGHTGHKGTAEEGIRLYLKRANFYYSPAEEGIRLRDIFPPSAGHINLTKQLSNGESPLGASNNTNNTWGFGWPFISTDE